MSDALITVRVTPRAARDEVAGWHDGVLRVHLRAPPVDGRANDALRRLLAHRLGVPQSAVRIVSGDTARIKRIRVEGLDMAEVRRVLDLSPR
jgi:uncharacterized protein (TIGR00251 family)